MFDPNVAILSDYQWIPGQAWPSPDWIGRVPDSWSGTVYKATQLAMRSPIIATYSVPEFAYKANQQWAVSHARLSHLGSLHGGAPTSGIYTGIPSGCGPGGMPTGGNPYS